MYHLKHTPLQIAARGHATDYYLGVHKSHFGQYDSYNPFRKQKAWKYNPPYVMKILIEEKTTYTDAEINSAKKKVLDVMKNRKAPYFFRPEAAGEAYFHYSDGRFKYKKGISCKLFDSFIQEKYITPISEDLWEDFRPAEIK